MPIKELVEIKVAFVDHLKDVEKVMDHLRQKGVISKEEEERVTCKTRVSEKNRELFVVLEGNPWEEIKNIVTDILLITKNQFLVNKIRGDSDDTQSQSLKALIRTNLVYLTEHLCDIPSVLIHLLEQNFITDNEVDIINHKVGIEKASELFGTLIRRDVQDKAALIAIFRRTGNRQLVDKLLPN